jgi:hypothetical protein
VGIGNYRQAGEVFGCYLTGRSTAPVGTHGPV